MKTLTSFFNRKKENAEINGFENEALSFMAMNKIRGGDGDGDGGDTGSAPDVWIPDGDETP